MRVRADNQIVEKPRKNNIAKDGVITGLILIPVAISETFSLKNQEEKASNSLRTTLSMHATIPVQSSPCTNGLESLSSLASTKSSSSSLSRLENWSRK